MLYVERAAEGAALPQMGLFSSPQEAEMVEAVRDHWLVAAAVIVLVAAAVVWWRARQ